MHGPGHNHFPFLPAIAVEYGSRHPLSGNAAAGGWAYRLNLPAFDSIGGEIRAHVSRTNRHDMNSWVLQFDSRCFSNGIHGELAGRIGSAKCHRNVTGDTRNI